MRKLEPIVICGSTFMAAAVAAAVTNAVFTPMLRKGEAFAITLVSPAFLGREISSAVCALCLLLGAALLWPEVPRSGGTTFAVVLAITGSALLLATEWSQIFDMRDVASVAPQTIAALSSRRGLHASDLGAMIALLAFTTGWLAVAVVILRTRFVPARSGWLIIAGFVAIPLLQALTHNRTGAIAGNLILALGWFLLGRDLVSRGRSGVATTFGLR